MRIAIVENDVIVNIIVVPDGSDPGKFGGIELPEGLGIGDKLHEPEVTTDDVLNALLGVSE